MDDDMSFEHMRLASKPDKNFIPHHVVLKSDGDVSQLRAVFDVSAKSLSLLSLNEALGVGPKLRNDTGRRVTTSMPAI